MTDRDNNRVNLAALQRVDPYISQIVDTASQVALYKYDAFRGEWDRTDIEGALFIYARSAPPFNGFIIMNRLNTTNQIEPLTKDLEFKKEIPYLLYKNAKLCIYGIWFYEGKDYVRISDRLMNLLGEVNKKTISGRQRRASESDSKTEAEETNVDILSMLLRAQERFTKGSGNGTTVHLERSPAEPKYMVDNLRNGDVIRPKPVKAPPQGPVDRKQPFVFGSGGGNNTVASLFANAQAQFQFSFQSSPPALVRSAKTGPPPFPFPNTTAVKVLGGSSTAAGAPRPPNESRSPEPEKRPGVTNASWYAGNPPTPSQSSFKVTGDVTEEEDAEESARKNLPRTARRRLSVDDILTPAMIGLGCGTQHAVSPLLNAPSPSDNLALANAALMSPMMFATPSMTPSKSETVHTTVSRVVDQDAANAVHHHHHLNPLTKEQLAQSLEYLLRNDDDFVSRIHQAYVSSLLAATVPTRRTDNRH